MTKLKFTHIYIIQGFIHLTVFPPIAAHVSNTIVELNFNTWQLEEEHAATKETINSILQSSLLHHQNMEQRKLLKIDKNTGIYTTTG